MSSHFSYKFRLEAVFMVSFWFAQVHKIISMACILNKKQKQLRPQWKTSTLSYLCEQRNGCVMAKALTCQSLPTKDWAWSQTSPCRICGGQTDTRASFSLSILVLPWQYHSNNNSYLFIHPSPILYNVFNQHTYKNAIHKHQRYVIQYLPSYYYRIVQYKSRHGLSCQLQVTRVFHIFLNFAFS